MMKRENRTRRFFARAVPATLLLAFVLVGAPHEAAADGGDWSKVEEKDGIAVYRRDVPGSDVIAFRGDAVIAAPLVRVASVLADRARATEWTDRLVETRIVRRISDTEHIEYAHFKSPPLVSDRDFVYQTKTEYDATKKSLVIRVRSVTDSAAPATSHVRGSVTSTFVLTPTADGKGTHLNAEVHCDPRGALPKFVVNMVQKDWPRNTFVALRTQVAKPNINESQSIKKLIAPGG